MGSWSVRGERVAVEHLQQYEMEMSMNYLSRLISPFICGGLNSYNNISTKGHASPVQHNNSHLIVILATEGPNP